MYVYIYILEAIDGVTMFRAIKTVDRVDDGGASVSIRWQIDLATRNPDKTNGKLLSHVGRNCNPRGHFVLSKIIPILPFRTRVSYR